MAAKEKRFHPTGFTLIELMIVIAIIGILAAIAIPNFIAYRNKTFCTMAESDADYILAGITDYFAISTHTNYPVNNHVQIVDLGGKFFDLSNDNTATISGTIDSIVITVTDQSGRCPSEYRNAHTKIWIGGGNVVERRM